MKLLAARDRTVRRTVLPSIPPSGGLKGAGPPIDTAPGHPKIGRAHV
jgi:hypothetical protein